MGITSNTVINLATTFYNPGQSRYGHLFQWQEPRLEETQIKKTSKFFGLCLMFSPHNYMKYYFKPEIVGSYLCKRNIQI